MCGFYEGENYTEFLLDSCIDDFLDFVLRKEFRNYWIYAHFGGKYDFQFLLERLRHRTRYQCKFVLTAAKILKLTVTDGSGRDAHRWHFVDSSGLFPHASLKKLCESFETKTRKLAGTVNFKTERVSKKDPSHRQYLKNDCVCLYEVLEGFLQIEKIAEEGLNITIASQAMNMFRRTMKHKVMVNPYEVDQFVRKGYYGGRVEIYKTEGKDLNYYDVNSMFPYTMRSFEIPLQFRNFTKKFEGKLGFYDVTISASENYIPALPYRYEGKLIFPNGSFRGVYFSDELVYALSRGYRVETVHSGAVFYGSKDFFSEYIDYFYELKRSAVKGSSRELVAKYLLNSLYGKFGQKNESQILKTRDGTEKAFEMFHSPEMYEKTRLIVVKEFNRRPYMLPHISAAITAYARVHLQKLALASIPYNCYYTDTDSVMTDTVLPTGDKLGELKLEKDGFDGVFKLPKGYDLITRKLFKDQDGKVYKPGESFDRKMKGFPREFLLGLTLQQFDKLDFTYRKMIFASFKRSLISNGSPLSEIEITKSIKNRYSKRRILDNGNTEPLYIRDGVVIN